MLSLIAPEANHCKGTQLGIISVILIQCFQRKTLETDEQTQSKLGIPLTEYKQLITDLKLQNIEVLANYSAALSWLTHSASKEQAKKEAESSGPTPILTLSELTSTDPPVDLTDGIAILKQNAITLLNHGPKTLTNRKKEQTIYTKGFHPLASLEHQHLMSSADKATDTTLFTTLQSFSQPLNQILEVYLDLYKQHSPDNQGETVILSDLESALTDIYLAWSQHEDKRAKFLNIQHRSTGLGPSIFKASPLVTKEDAKKIKHDQAVSSKLKSNKFPGYQSSRRSRNNNGGRGGGRGGGGGGGGGSAPNYNNTNNNNYNSNNNNNNKFSNNNQYPKRSSSNNNKYDSNKRSNSNSSNKSNNNRPKGGTKPPQHQK